MNQVYICLCVESFKLIEHEFILKPLENQISILISLNIRNEMLYHFFPIKA